MINPHTRFTFFHATVSPTGTVVNQPVGWRDASLSLVRDPKGHSLVEFFKNSFVWYGAARTFINAVKTADGPDAILRVLIEFKSNRDWETIFDGLLDIGQEENLSLAGTFYKKVVPIIRNDFWATFINRRASKVNLQATVDLDGNARTAVNKITLPLPSQVIRNTFERQIDWADNVTRTLDETAIVAYPVAGLTTMYLMFSNANIVLDEIESRQDYGTVIRTTKPTADESYLMKVKNSGSYTFNASLRYAILLSTSRTFDVKWYRAIKTAGVITETQIGSTQSGTDSSILDDGARVLSLTTDLLAGDEFYIWCELTISSAVATASYFPDYDSDLGAPYSPVYTELSVIGDTIFQDTETDAYLIKDAFESVLSKIIGQDSVVQSTMFGTCKRLNAIFRGIHGRGLTFTQKPFTTSFDELWEGFEPVVNCGFGYTEVAGVKKIVIEEKSFFYGKVPSVFISNVSGLTSRYDAEKHFKRIEVGFSKRFAESKGGLDDPQTLAAWQTTFRTIGIPFKIISNFFLASLGIEQNRRDTVELNKDGKLDEDIIMVAVKDDGSGGYVPETGSDFNAITGLLNSATRYNVRHTCARIFKRWQSFLQGCVQHLVGEDFKYADGEGNRTMTSQFETIDCESTDDPEPVLDEDANVEITNDHLFIPEIYKCKAPMSKATYDAILADKENAIGISQGTSDYLPMHIIDLDYKLFGGYAEFVLLLASNTPVNPGEGILMEDGNFILQEDGSNILLED